MAAARRSPRAAAGYWDRYLSHRPHDVFIRLQRAKIALLLGEHKEVPDLAWEAWKHGGDRNLPARSLYEVAGLQRVDREGGFTEERRERVRAIIKVLSERFGGQPEVEQLRFFLLTQLGGVEAEEGAPPVDVKQLEEAGLVDTMPVEEVGELFATQRRLQDAGYGAYTLGHLPYDSFCSLIAQPAALVFDSLLRGRVQGPFVLAAPASLSAPPAGLGGQKLVSGHLELLLVDHLGLWTAVRETLGADGKFLLFEDVVERVTAEAAELSHRDAHAELENLERLRHELREIGIREAETDPKEEDPVWAARRGLVLADTDLPDGAFSPWALADSLWNKGYIPIDAHREIRSLLGAEPRRAPAPEPMPDSIALDFATLWALFDAGVLDQVRRAFRGSVWLSPSAVLGLRWREQETRCLASASDRASRIQRLVGSGLSEGWIEARPRRCWDDLPELASAHTTLAKPDLYRAPLARVLTLFRLLEEEPGTLC